MTLQPSVRNLSIDGDRLWDSLMEMAKIGKTAKDGVCRLALTDLDRESRDLFIKWCKAEGCSIRIDKMGNIFARREGRNPDLPPVVMGSHLDSQPTGGKYDGVYGVLSGLEVIRALNEAKYETEAPLEVVCWTNEEGSRFAPAMVSSAARHSGVPLPFVKTTWPKIRASASRNLRSMPVMPLASTVMSSILTPAEMSAEASFSRFGLEEELSRF